VAKSIQVFSYSKCGTCKKALKWLEDNDIAYELLDIIQSPPGKKLLKQAMNQQLRRKSLFNTSGMSYRQLGASAIDAMTDQKAIEALDIDPKLIKRPFVLLLDGTILIGFKVEIWEQSLLN
tara:strand:+ start:608 stop:970 length:363 start_codon:yes stop_codon:yes gene_type:complete